jgi:TolB-like protein
MALLRDGKVVPIGQRGFTLLSVLADADETVSRTELIEAVWPGTLVEEGNLNVQIAGLRKALGLRPDGQDWILTVARVGYRLVRDADAPDSAAGLDLPSLAVLPFQTITEGEHERQFARGVVEDLINALGRFRDFELEPRGSPGTQYVVEGGVRHIGSQLRVTTQLADRRTGTQVWADSIDCADGDILAAQDEVTRRLAGGAVSALQLAEIELANRETIPSVYTLYLQAVSKYKLLSPAGHAEGWELLGRALQLDPRRPRTLSHGAMLLCHNWRRRPWPALSSDDRATCAEFIERAELGVSDDARVLAECSEGLLHCTRDYRRAVEVARRGCVINPFNIQVLRNFAIASLHCGDLNEADDAFQRVYRLGPLAMLLPVTLTGLAHVAMIRGDYTTALGWAEKSLAVSARFDHTYFILVAANAHLGRLDAARAHLTDLLKRAPSVTVAAVKAMEPDYDPSRIAPILAGLKLAGMP